MLEAAVSTFGSPNEFRTWSRPSACFEFRLAAFTWIARRPMSAMVASGHFYDGYCSFLLSGVPAQAAAERASQLTGTCAGPVPPDSAITAAARTWWLADGAGKVPRVSQGRPAGRFCASSS
jgi:hypothetical protein